MGSDLAVASMPWPLMKPEKIVTLRAHLLCSQQQIRVPQCRQGHCTVVHCVVGACTAASIPSEKGPFVFRNLSYLALCVCSAQTSLLSFFVCFMPENCSAKFWSHFCMLFEKDSFLRSFGEKIWITKNSWSTAGVGNQEEIVFLLV